MRTNFCQLKYTLIPTKHSLPWHQRGSQSIRSQALACALLQMNFGPVPIPLRFRPSNAWFLPPRCFPPQNIALLTFFVIQDHMLRVLVDRVPCKLNCLLAMTPYLYSCFCSRREIFQRNTSFHTSSLLLLQEIDNFAVRSDRHGLINRSLVL